MTTYADVIAVNDFSEIKCTTEDQQHLIDLLVDEDHIDIATDERGGWLMFWVSQYEDEPVSLEDAPCVLMTYHHHKMPKMNVRWLV